MNILITGGTGLIGRALTKSFQEDGHQVWVLTRNPEKHKNHSSSAIQFVAWDGHSATGWRELVNEMDAIINLAGVNTASWPWTNAKKKSFWDSRVQAGEAVLEAIRSAGKKPAVVIQASGINHYGLRGDSATESTAPGDDFLAQLTVPWEDSTKPVEEMGVRRAVIRTAVVLTRDNVIMKLMELPAMLFFGGRLGSGQQTLPWIHLADEVAAIRFIIDHEQMKGAYNLVAPESTTNDEFLRMLAKVIRRPYWFHIPAGIMRLVLGEMSVMVLEGRPARPQRLLDAGYQFRFASLDSALRDLYRSQPRNADAAA